MRAHAANHASTPTILFEKDPLASKTGKALRSHTRIEPVTLKVKANNAIPCIYRLTRRVGTTVRLQLMDLLKCLIMSYKNNVARIYIVPTR